MSDKSLTLSARQTADFELLARMGTEGMAWAEEYVERYGGDVITALGWFANAIEAGRRAGRSET